MSEQYTEKLEGLVKILRTEVNAKKAILKEVLRTVDKDEEKSSSVKRRTCIRDILNCEVSIPCSSNEIFSADLIDSFRFETHVVTRFQIRNRSEGDLSINISASVKDCSVRWIFFESQSSTIVSLVVSCYQSATLCVSVPLTAFFDDDKLSLCIHGKIIQARSQLFNSSFHSIVECNQTLTAPPEAFISKFISISEATEDLDLKAIEYMDEKRAIRIVHSLFVVYSHLEVQASPEVSIFRRNFPTFVENDFETWRLYAGGDRFEGVLVYTQIIGDVMRSRVIATNIASCRKFLRTMNEKCF